MTDNPHAKALGKLGGKATSETKTKANREKMRQFWHDVKTGKRPAPNHSGRPVNQTSKRKKI